MNDQEAGKEALLRWGKDGTARRRRPGQVELGLKPYAVGKSDSNLFESLGEGDTWEEAFAEADSRSG